MFNKQVKYVSDHLHNMEIGNTLDLDLGTLSSRDPLEETHG